MNTQINALPSSTWEHLGVNSAGKRAVLFSADSKEPAPVLNISTLPKGITLAECAPDGVGYSGIGQALDTFVKKNLNASHFITVNDVAAAPLVLACTLNQAHPQLVLHNGIYAKAHSAVTVMEIYRSEEDTAGNAASLTQIYAKEGANIRLIQVNLLGDDCRSWNSVAVQAEADANVELVRVTLGSKNAYAGIRTVLAGKRSSFNLKQMYFGSTQQILDFNDIAEHISTQTSSEMHSAGVLADECDKILRGTIDFKQGSACSVGHESETVLLLSEKARNRTAPLILCGEEQVEGQHAATIGRLNQNQLYYLCSRGLTLAEARQLMIEAQFAPALDEIPDEDLRNEILSCVRRRLDEHVTFDE